MNSSLLIVFLSPAITDGDRGDFGPRIVLVVPCETNVPNDHIGIRYDRSVFF